MTDPNTAEFISRLASLLRRWCRDDAISSIDERWLVEVTVDLVLKDFRCRKRLQAAASAQEASLRQITTDYLGEIFARHPANALAIMLEDVLDSDDAALVQIFRRRTVNKVRQQLFHRWPEIDPVGHKVHHNLWLAFRHNPAVFVLIPEDDPIWVTSVRDGDIRDDKPEITFAQILGLIGEFADRWGDMPSLVRALLETVADEDRWCALVRIDDVLEAALVEAARQGIFSGQADYFQPPPIDPAFQLAVNKAIDRALKEVRTILNRYANECKLDREMATAFDAAIGNLLCDYGLTGLWQGDYFEYLARHCPGLTREMFDSQYKVRFQYVAVTAEREFRKALRREWGE